MKTLITVDESFVAQLRTRLNQSEDAWIERKPAPKDDLRDVRRTLVAFANSVKDGEFAVLFIGANNGGDHVGVNDADDLQKKIRGVAEMTCYPPISYTAVPFSVHVRNTNVVILAIVIPSSEHRPHFSGPAYVRRGSETIIASAEVFAELIASQHDKVQVLQRVRGEVSVTVKSPRGLWYQFTGQIPHVNPHVVDVKNEMGFFWPVPIDEITIISPGPNRAAIEIKARGSESEHIEAMLNRWINFETFRYMTTSPNAISSDYILKQLAPHAQEVLRLTGVLGWSNREKRSRERQIVRWAWELVSGVGHIKSALARKAQIIQSAW